jgi:hypothetical protein
MKRLILLVIFATLLSGCVNLKEVREFAGESAQLSEYTELTTRFRDTFERERPYLKGQNLEAEAVTDRGRKEVYPDLIKIHNRVSLYMKTLARLAGDESFDLSNKIGTLADGIKGNPNFKINEKHVEAYSEVAKVIARWITSAHQQSAVRDMVREGNDKLQVLLAGMGDLVRLYRKTNIEEKKIVLGVFEINLPFETPKDQLLGILARLHVQEKESEFSAAEAKYNDAENGIKKISEGHMALYTNIEKLSTDEVRNLIDRAAKDIQILRQHIVTLRN